MKRTLLALSIIAFACLATALSGCQNPASLLGTDGPEETEGDPARDAWVLPDEMGAIYAAQCAVCHGPDQRGSSLGPSLLGDLTRGDSVEALVRVLLSQPRRPHILFLTVREWCRADKINFGARAKPFLPIGFLLFPLNMSLAQNISEKY